MGLILATAILACAGVASSSGMGAGAGCTATFHISPGTGSTFVSQIRVHNVSCAKATFAIGKYEQSLKHSKPFSIAHQTYTCVRATIGLKSNGEKRITCRKGSKSVSWRSVYGI
jgi:hypothetical protein